MKMTPEDKSTKPEIVIHDIVHYRQRFNWDCGVSCVLMLLPEHQRNELLDNFTDICKDEGFNQSTWTIDLCYLLKRFNIKHQMYTTMLGVNEDYKRHGYYEKILDLAVGTAKHILVGCKVLLDRGYYSRRHDKVLLIIREAVSLAVARAQKELTTNANHINFAKEGSRVKRNFKPYSILSSAVDWTLLMDTYEKHYKIPDDVAISTYRPDILLYSRKLKRVLLIELTVPWETNIPKDHAIKMNKYFDLTNELTRNGFRVNLYAVEVGARGLPAKSLYTLFKDLGLSRTTDRDRVRRRFDEAPSAGIHVTRRALSIDELLSHIRTQGPAIALIDAGLLVCELCKHNKLRAEFRRWSGGGYRGHYVVVAGVSRGRVLYRDPALGARLCAARPARLAAARAAPGTDHDLILLRGLGPSAVRAGAY